MSPDEIDDFTEANRNLNLNPPPDDPPLLPGWATLIQLSSETGYSTGTLRRLCSEGKVTCYILDKKFWLMYRPSFSSYLETKGRGQYSKTAPNSNE